MQEANVDKHRQVQGSKGGMMVRSTGPRHDWVFLTRDELRTLDRMERSLAADVDDDGGSPRQPLKLRSRALLRLRRMAFVPLLVLLGVAVLVDGRFRSGLEAGAGAVLVVVGVVACYWWGWHRTRAPYRRAE